MNSFCFWPRQRVYATADSANVDSAIADTNGSVDSSEIIDIKADQFSDHDQNGILNLKLTYKDLWALGLTTAMGGHFFSWSSGLSAGFGSHAIALGIWTVAYYCLVMCISELSSALPFAGGVYGLARVTLGVFPGFLVAVVDSYKPVLNAASAAYVVGNIITAITDCHKDMQFVTWAFFYAYCLAINFYGGRTFWWINRVNASITCLLVFIYIFGTIQFADFNRNAPYPDESGSDAWFQGGVSEFMRILPSPTRFFLGIQSINLACGQIKNPKQEVPRACMGSMSTVILTGIAVTFLACSINPGTAALSEMRIPLNPGFAKMLYISQRAALVVSIPSVLFYGNTYIYFLGQQFSSMGRSGLLNPAFGAELPYRNTPYFAHIFGAAVGYAVCTAQYFYSSVSPELNSLKVLASMFTYIAIAVSFIIFRVHYPAIKREYVSPWGIPGAVICILVSVLNIISVAAFQDNQHAIIGFAVIISLSSLYYYYVVRHRQVKHCADIF